MRIQFEANLADHEISALRAALGTEREIDGRKGVLISVDPPVIVIDTADGGAAGKEVID